MSKALTSLIIALLALAPSARGQGKRYGKLGEFVVTATSMTTLLAKGNGQRDVAVFVRVRYGGTDTACASFSAKLKASDNSEYAEFSRPSDVRLPAPPRVSHVSHGQESNGAYVFELPMGAEPVELEVTMDSPDISCDSGPLGAALPVDSAPAVELDVHDLSAPAANIDAETGLPLVRVTANNFPTCLYCPRADYSREAKKAKIQGVVELSVVVTAEGKVTGINVLKGLGHGLDESAVKAVSTWRLKPAHGPDGQPAAVRQIVEVTFQLY